MEEIIQILSKKHNLPKAAIRAIIETPFKCMSSSMRKREFKNFIFLYIGKFVVLEKRLHYAKLAIKKKQDEQDRANNQRLEEQPFEGSRDREDSPTEIRDMC